MSVNNLPKFYDDETLSAEKLNMLRNALVQQFTTGITASEIAWPLVADGTLDMNNNDIVNIGNVSGATHVNATQSLEAAIYTANNNGYGNIVIDPGFIADATDAGLEITADDVTITGSGTSSKIACPGTEYGIKISGKRCKIRDITFTGSAPSAVLVLADSATISGCNFYECGSLVLGSDLTYVTDANINSNIMYSVISSGLTIYGAQKSCIANNYIRTALALTPALRLHSDGVSRKDISITDNRIVSSGSTGIGLQVEGTSAALSGSCVGVTFTGNTIYGEHVAVHLGDIQDYTFSSNVVNGPTFIASGIGIVSVNTMDEVFIHTCKNVYFTENTLTTLNVATDGVTDSACEDLCVVNNLITGTTVVESSHPFTFDPGIRMFVSNTVLGSLGDIQDAFEDYDFIPMFIHYQP